MNDKAFGIHSRIPICCIDFYTDKWEMEYTRGTPYAQAVDAAGWHYVPCPRCLAVGHKANIRWCVNECGGDHPKDFK